MQTLLLRFSVFRRLLEGIGSEVKGKTGGIKMWGAAERTNNRRIIRQKSIQH
jgi:hypothetical protein